MYTRKQLYFSRLSRRLQRRIQCFRRFQITRARHFRSECCLVYWLQIMQLRCVLMSQFLMYRLCADPLERVLWCLALLRLRPVQPSSFNARTIVCAGLARPKHTPPPPLDGVTTYTAYQHTIQHK
jgi:hypothetical protein